MSGGVMGYKYEVGTPEKGMMINFRCAVCGFRGLNLERYVRYYNVTSEHLCNVCCQWAYNYRVYVEGDEF